MDLLTRTLVKFQVAIAMPSLVRHNPKNTDFRWPQKVTMHLFTWNFWTRAGSRPQKKTLQDDSFFIAEPELNNIVLPPLAGS